MSGKRLVLSTEDLAILRSSDRITFRPIRKGFRCNQLDLGVLNKHQKEELLRLVHAGTIVKYPKVKAVEAALLVSTPTYGLFIWDPIRLHHDEEPFVCPHCKGTQRVRLEGEQACTSCGKLYIVIIEGFAQEHDPEFNLDYEGDQEFDDEFDEDLYFEY